MGFCKCRVVTSLFCFDHRKNVCENCLLSDHPNCIVKTYLQWLQDSDFNSTCTICKQSLSNNATSANQESSETQPMITSSPQPTVRLMCLDVFHEHCLNDYFTNVSSHYSCPICQASLFPDEFNGKNGNSPIARRLKEQLMKFQWAVPFLSSGFGGAGADSNSSGAAGLPGNGSVVLDMGTGYNATSESNTGRPNRSNSRIYDDDDKYGDREKSWLNKTKKKLIRTLENNGIPYVKEQLHRAILILIVVFIFLVFIFAGRSFKGTSSALKAETKLPVASSDKITTLKPSTASVSDDSDHQPSILEQQIKGTAKRSASKDDGFASGTDVESPPLPPPPFLLTDNELILQEKLDKLISQTKTGPYSRRPLNAIKGLSKNLDEGDPGLGVPNSDRQMQLEKAINQALQGR